jgi:dienelactone hydrolase
MFFAFCAGASTRRGLVGAFVAVFTSIISADSPREPRVPSETRVAAAPQRIALRATLGAGFTTDAELTLPSSRTGRVPAVLLVHGATPADMDFTVPRSGADTTRLFREIADSLAARGIASLRYHKRWVSGAGKVDIAKFYATDMQMLLADARTMLDTLRARPEIDPARVVVWGWSEGSAIVAQLAAHDTTLAGVIAHGPVVRTFAETLRGQFGRVGVPYLLRFAASDSTMDLDAITRAERGDGGMLVRSHASMLLDPFAMQKGERKLSAFVDRDSSGRIHVINEAQRVVEMTFQGPALGMYADGRALPGWRIMADSVRLPILVLHGEADANISVADARELARLLCDRRDATVHIYPQLGHSLGVARAAEQDDFRSIDTAPLADAARWISALPAASSRPGSPPAARRGTTASECAAAR